MYTILVTIALPDTKQQVRDLMNAVDAKLEGRYPVGVGVDQYFDEYVLMGVVPDVQATVIIGFNQDVSQNILVEISKQSSAYRQVAFSPSKTKDEIRQYLKNLAGQQGAEAIWQVTAGDNLNTASPEELLAKFTSVYAAKATPNA